MQRIIVTADDYGMCSEIDKAIDDGVANGFITSTNVLVNLTLSAAAICGSVFRGFRSACIGTLRSGVRSAIRKIVRRSSTKTAFFGRSANLGGVVRSG